MRRPILEPTLEPDESSARRTDDLDCEIIADAAEDGDAAYAPGTARAALRHRDFRIFWCGLFASNVGTWMQTVVLGAYGLELTGDAGYVGLLQFAILGPLVFLSTISGVIADAVDRRRYLVAVQAVQLVGAFVLAGITLTESPSKWSIFGCVFAIGIANAMGGPGMSAISPSLVPKQDLPGAISLFSFQMNMSRVIGPIIGVALYQAFDRPAIVFVANGFTYLFAISALLIARYPRRAGASLSGSPFARLTSGIRYAWADPLIRRVLFILWTLSILSLNFISFMPEHAQGSLDIAAKSTGYGILYALFGLGAASGAMSVGSFMAGYDKAKLVRPALGAFAVTLATFALLRGPAFAYPVVFLLGYAYFVAITSLSTVLQSNVSDEVRGRIMSLWIMGFGGAVGLAALVFGPIARSHLPALLFAGAVWGAILAAVSVPDRLRAQGSNVAA